MKMSGLTCPKCGARLAKGSTFCIRCGTRLKDASPQPEPPIHGMHKADSQHEETSEIFPSLLPESPQELVQKTNDENLELPDVDDTQLPDIEESSGPEIRIVGKHSGGTQPRELSSTESTSVSTPKPAQTETTSTHGGFREIEPPKVITDREPEIKVRIIDEPPSIHVRETVVHTDDEPVSSRPVPPTPISTSTTPSAATSTRPETRTAEKETPPVEAAFEHLFPKGRGETSDDFIEAVVGTQERIAVTKPLIERESPMCPNCGTIVTSDGFEYPPYVFEAMARARLESGEHLLKEEKFEDAIECFEKAKLLAQSAKNEKLIETCNKGIDEGYESMAASHFALGEKHLKAHEFEWAIVQFKKARQIYMFTTRSKMRAKCAEKVRECYFVWGKTIEEEGDRLAKAGRTREALVKYQEAAEKYRQSGDDRRLRGLEKKIRKV